MLRWRLSLAALLLVGCEISTRRPDVAASEGAISVETARAYFAEYSAIAAADGGKLWKKRLDGPFLFVEPDTRQVVANMQDARGALAAKGGVFVGRLGPNDMIANTSTEWSGTRWTMVMWSDDLAADAAGRRKMMLHEAFHRVQPELGPAVAGEPNEHLDSREGRTLLQLEWNALEGALEAKPDAVAAALAFRAARRKAFPEAAARENALEIHEGLAEYTGARASGASDADVLASGRARRAKTSGFVRSFAYVSGPLYGYLLDRTGEGWRETVHQQRDLGAMLAARMHLDVPASADADAWGGAALRVVEEAREEKRVAQVAEWRTALVDGPVLVIDLATVTTGSFDPRKVHAFAPNQVVYTDRTLVASWGKLTVENGAFLEDRAAGKGFVSLTKKKEWKLDLAAGWALVSGARAGDQIIAPRRN